MPEIEEVADYKMVDGELVLLTQEEKDEIMRQRVAYHESLKDPVYLMQVNKMKGKEILDAFMAYLASQEASVEKLEALADNYANIYILVLNGALETAKKKINEIDATTSILTTDDIAYLISLF